MSLNLNKYIANGVTTVFPYTFKLLSDFDVAVVVNGHPLIKDIDYVISGIGSDAGGNVATTVAPANGAEVVIVRYITLERLIHYQTNGDMTATTLNSDFDRIWMALQDSGTDMVRMLKLPIGTTTDQVIAADAATRAGRPVVFDAAGNVALGLEPYDTQAAKAKGAACAAKSSAANAAISEANAATLATQASASACEIVELYALIQGYVSAINPNNLVHKTGDESIAGVKEFQSLPLLPGNATEPLHPVTKQQLDALLAGVLFPGQMVAMFCNAPPPGTLVCNGGEISRTLYAKLFAAIGTTFGAGNGSTTFNLPNIKDGFAILGGGTVGAITTGSVISHNHTATLSSNGGHEHSWPYAPMQGTSTGTGSYSTGGGALQWTSNTGSHSHTPNINNTGGINNLAAGMRLLICIAY